MDTSRTSRQYERSVRKYEAERRLVVPGRNIKDLETPTEKKYLSTTFHRMWYYAHNMTKHLCSHSKAEPSRHHSHHLHYGQPYLRLGPFKGSLIYFSSVNLYIDFHCNGKVFNYFVVYFKLLPNTSIEIDHLKLF